MVETPTRTGREHARAIVEQPRDHARFAVAKIRLAMGRKDFRNRHARMRQFDLGVRIGERLSGGEVILLNGPLGAGKTVFVKGVARALGVAEEDVTSPSFTLVNLHQGRLLLYHIDLYRLDEGAAAAHAVDLVTER